MKQSTSKLNNRRKKFVLSGIVVFLLVIIIIFIDFNTKKQGEESLSDKSKSETEIVDGFHVPTGLKDAEGLKVVITHCTACHSAQLIIQNRMNKERWNATIRWMQESQNLWDLGDNQEIIVDYLVENYPVENKGRRKNLEKIEWYDFNE